MRDGILNLLKKEKNALSIIDIADKWGLDRDGGSLFGEE